MSTVTPTHICSRGFARAKARDSLSKAIWTYVLLLTTIIIGGCEPGSDDKSESVKDSTQVTRTAQRGPVELTVTVSRSDITIADRIKLSIEAVAEQGVDVELPQFGQQLNEFTIHGYRKWPAEPHDAGGASSVPLRGRRWRQEYDLEIFLSGEYEIPGITAKFRDARLSGGRAGKVIESQVSSEPIAIKVNSLLEGEFDATQFRDIKGAVELPEETSWAAAWWICGILVVALGLGWWLLRRRVTAQAETIIPAHRWALDQLDQLDRRRLPAQGQTHEYYFLLSGIVREYIERRFTLMAPEQTTLEFLESIRDQAPFSAEHKTLLCEFLQACDLVKFALLEPADDDALNAFRSAREFVLETIQSDEPREAAA